jgi:hypothetical protein
LTFGRDRKVDLYQRGKLEARSASRMGLQALTRPACLREQVIGG